MTLALSTDFHIPALKKALALAQERKGFCAPNPAVGALVVKNGHVLSSGVHFQYGAPHAEGDALRQLGAQAKNADLYVTLEPCCHWGKTPPCTELIIQSGIKTVYYGMKDPNPRVSGKGVHQLEQAGIVCHRLELSEIQDFYKSYVHWTVHKKPWVTAKIALSLDGKCAGFGGIPVQITGPELKRETHRRRQRADAILTTINTIVNDNPQLNVRNDYRTLSKALYILDSKLRLPLTANIFKTAKSITVFHKKNAENDKKNALISLKVRCIEIESTQTGLDLNAVMEHIGNDGVHDLWVEAGGRCYQALLNQNLIHTGRFAIAPKILGPQAMSAFDQEFDLTVIDKKISWEWYGCDAVCEIHFFED